MPNKSTPVEAGMPERPKLKIFKLPTVPSSASLHAALVCMAENTDKLDVYTSALESHASQQASQLAELKNKLAEVTEQREIARRGFDDAYEQVGELMDVKAKLAVAKEALMHLASATSLLFGEAPKIGGLIWREDYFKKYCVNTQEALDKAQHALTTLQGVV